MNYKNWYALTIQVNKERPTREQMIARRSVFNDKHLVEVEYLKSKELIVEKNGKRSVKEKLLMPGYLLVRMEPEVVENENGEKVKVFPSETFDLISQTPGVRSFANCNKDTPVPLRPSEVKRMFEMCDDAHLEVKQNLISDFQEGDILDVILGPFAGHKMEVVNIQGQKLLGQLDMFGRIIPAEFTLDQVYKSNG